jgi:hypothetical protein
MDQRWRTSNVLLSCTAAVYCCCVLLLLLLLLLLQYIPGIVATLALVMINCIRR